MSSKTLKCNHPFSGVEKRGKLCFCFVLCRHPIIVSFSVLPSANSGSGFI
jgi:hypothetical protein